MTGADKARLALLAALIPVLMLSIVGNQQFTNAFPLWAQKHMDFALFGWDVPVTWLQAVDAVGAFWFHHSSRPAGAAAYSVRLVNSRVNSASSAAFRSDTAQ